MTTIKDLARILNISPSTVSRAINGSTEISSETTKKVLELAEKMNYIPNKYAQQLVGKDVLTVGFTIPDISDSFFSQSAVGVEEILHKHGHDIAYHTIQRSTKKLCEFLIRAKELRYSSVIITPEHWDDEIIQYIHKTQLPVVVLRRKTPDSILNLPYVDSDHYGGACELTRYLLDLGHRHIAFITYDVLVFNERRMGYEDTMLRNAFPQYIYESEPKVNSDDLIHLGYEATKEILHLYPQVTAIIGANDMLAIGVLQALYEAGIQVPEQMSVAGFDNRSITDLFNIQLTTVSQPLRELGNQAGEMALKMAQSPTSIPTSVVLKTRLIVRSTTASPPI